MMDTGEQQQKLNKQETTSEIISLFPFSVSVSTVSVPVFPGSRQRR